MNGKEMGEDGRGAIRTAPLTIEMEAEWLSVFETSP
jgi:hypothetical protein